MVIVAPFWGSSSESFWGFIFRIFFGVHIQNPFWGSYLESYKVIPKKELLWGLWVGLP